MSNFALAVYPGGYEYLTLRVTYPRYIAALNKDRIKRGFRPVSLSVAGNIWVWTISWYWNYYNPRNAKKKTQKSVGNAIRQTRKYAEQMIEYYKTIEHLLSEDEDDYWPLMDLVLSALEGQIPDAAEWAHEKEWAYKYTPMVAPGRTPKDPLVGVEKGMKNMKLGDESPTASTPSQEIVKPLPENRKRSRGDSEEEEEEEEEEEKSGKDVTMGGDGVVLNRSVRTMKKTRL